MTSIDELFKKPALPSNKRKFEVLPRTNGSHKSLKSGANGQANGQLRHDTVVEDDDELEAGPSLPPDDDNDYGPDLPDDEDGRFFGGGISKDESEVLDFMDGQGGEDIAPEKIDVPWVRKLALNFEKRISKNAELRAKFEDDPQKFMSSEADLDADVKALSILTEHPELYEEFAKLGCVNSLVSLLSHENADIAIDAIEIISELTDEDVEAETEQWNVVVDAMIEADLLDLLISNFSRFDENNKSDRNGVYHALSVLENLASRRELAEKIGKDTMVFQWLLTRIQKKESSVSQNKQYSAEVLAILLQSSDMNRRRVVELNAIDPFLQILAAYRKKDPEKGTEEEEFVENVFDCVTCVVDEVEGKERFVEAEGVELCLIMVKEGKMSKARALRLLDHALGAQTGQAVCSRLVNAAGLKVIFGTFTKKQDNQITEHLIGMFASLLRSLPAESDERIRTLAKFVEKDYEKIAKLVSLRQAYALKMDAVDRTIREEAAGTDDDKRLQADAEWLSRRLDAGLFCFQTLDVILAWLVAEDDGAGKKIRSLLATSNESLAVVRASLQGQLEDLLEAETEDEKTTKDMLNTLLGFLE